MRVNVKSQTFEGYKFQNYDFAIVQTKRSQLVEIRTYVYKKCWVAKINFR